MSPEFKQELGHAMTASTVGYIHANDYEVTPVILDGWTTSEDVRLLDKLSIKLTRTSGELFSVKINKFNNRNYIHGTKLGLEFLSALRIDTSLIKHHFPFHKANPHIDLIIRHIDSRKLSQLTSFFNALFNDEVVKWVDVLNGCVEAMRKEANGLKFKMAVNKFQRVSNKNHKELMKYIEMQFEAHSRLLVLRIDLGYRKPQGWPLKSESPVQYDDVKKHWTALLKFLNAKIPDLTGFAYKLEYGLEKLFHYHLLVLLDGSKVREDVTIAKIIGLAWNDITVGKGLHYNCNDNKYMYKSCGIGMINHNDHELREGLKMAAAYLTKTDYFIKMVAPENGRTFGKGNMPAPKFTNKGRPRKLKP